MLATTKQNNILRLALFLILSLLIIKKKSYVRIAIKTSKLFCSHPHFWPAIWFDL
jgi:hypothetical protein